MGRFGEEGIGANPFPLEGWIKGSHFTCPEDCKPDSISAYLVNTVGSAKIKAAIYKHSDNSYVGATEERTVSYTHLTLPTNREV